MRSGAAVGVPAAARCPAPLGPWCWGDGAELSALSQGTLLAGSAHSPERGMQTLPREIKPFRTPEKSCLAQLSPLTHLTCSSCIQLASIAASALAHAEDVRE